MNYYIVNKKILKYSEPLDASLYNYPALTAEQSAFYEANPTASVAEVLAMELTPPYVPTEEDLLQEAKAIKLSNLQAEETAIRDAGWTDESTGLKLFLREEDTFRYTQFKVLHSNKADDAIVQLGTFQGWQPLSNAEAQALLVRYGQYAEELYQTYSTRYAMLKYATTIEQIEAI